MKIQRTVESEPASPTPPVAPVERVVLGHSVLTVANQLGILDQIAGAGPLTARHVAADLDLDSAAVRVLLDALVEIDIIERDGTNYRVHPRLPDILRQMTPISDVLGQRILTGAPRLSGDRPDEAGSLYEGLVGLLGEFFADAAEEVAELLAAPELRILDVGAGAAPWSRAIARRERTCHIDAVDLPGVVDRTRRAVADAGLTDQFRCIEADFLDAELTPRYDLVLAANICHLFDATTTEALIARLASTARPAGTLAIIDTVPDHADSDRRRDAALYAAGLLTRTATGRVHTVDDYTCWLRHAGAVEITRQDCGRFPTTVIRAQMG
ncbi:MAG: class I SAM-dependent methyltransferase [Acidimicrobiales bacterium]|nr:class I SAM-dependent methyltransferase [Acidimicrobiales bacterium]